MSSIYLARQPIVSLDESLEAYEIMYRDFNQQTSVDNRLTSASVVNSILNKFGVKEFLNAHKAFIKVDIKFLMSDLILSIPHNVFILSLLNNIELDEKVIERIEQLHGIGFTIAINDIDLTEDNILEYVDILDKLSYFKINMYTDIGIEKKELIVVLQKQNIKIIATNIEHMSQYEIAKDLECDLYQGYWFAKPEILENETFDPSQFKVLNLYNMLINDEGIDEIALEFEKNQALTLQLLRFINSANFNFTTEVSSIKHILTLVGRKPLSSWLMLMIYSKSVSKNNKVTPLMLMVKNRTELMQNLLKAIKPDVNKNALGEAYLVGVLSLVDTIFKAPLSDILEYIHISDISKKALLHDEGALGKLYKLVRDIEAFNVQEIVTFTKRYKVQEEAVQDVILKSMEDVNSFESALLEV